MAGPDATPTSWESAEVVADYVVLYDLVRWVLGYPFAFRAAGLGRPDVRTVLDFGCGPGLVADRMARRFGVRVHAVDASPEMVDLAAATGNPLVEARRVVANRMPFLADGSVDAAISCFVFVCVPARADLRAILGEIHRVLRPGGRFTLLTPNPDETGLVRHSARFGEPHTHYASGDPVPVSLRKHDGWMDIVDTHWSTATFRELFEEAGFRIVAEERPLAADARDVVDAELVENAPWVDEHRVGPFLLLTGAR
ncbi:class I SAM-dependent methyltransferase [Streptoalloteichus hindustanus]|uniref:Ubiquinone/menaquinone biosynthesis C-methylase UbiE n=1 Tax=Streptoalloteichus hindustanus TaxID=2017 RepID=A0A1M5L0J8_STRHI|nr:class I SAM-dependent methyltransferase [Streptoalloteichus hindustanus]SHG57953.1 Ubiquinone/menaquinone biosynthesis C-methylase UbiE [Streptoalloteichus hindustanus]